MCIYKHSGDIYHVFHWSYSAAKSPTNTGFSIPRDAHPRIIGTGSITEDDVKFHASVREGFGRYTTTLSFCGCYAQIENESGSLENELSRDC